MNLQLLHWRNNKIKADDFPTHEWEVTMNYNSSIPQNYSRFIITTYSDSVLKSLSEIYPSIRNIYLTQLDKERYSLPYLIRL